MSPGDCPHAPSFTVPVFILHDQDLAALPDEDEMPPHGPLHRMPYPAPRWVGAEGEVSQANSSGARADEASIGNQLAINEQMVVDEPVNPNVADADMVGDAENAEMAGGAANVDVPDVSAPVLPAPVSPHLEFPVDASLPAGGQDFHAAGDLNAHISSANQVIPLKVVFQCLHLSLFPSKHLFFPFRNVSRIYVNLDTLVPSYFADSDLLWYLAKVLVEPTPAPASPAVVLQPSFDVEILEEMPPSKTPKRRRARRAKAPLDVAFLCRCKRLHRPDGFKAGSTPTPSLAPKPEPMEMLHPEAEPAELALSPYLGVPASSSAAPAPHLPTSLVMAIG